MFNTSFFILYLCYSKTLSIRDYFSNKFITFLHRDLGGSKTTGCNKLESLRTKKDFFVFFDDLKKKPWVFSGFSISRFVFFSGLVISGFGLDSRFLFQRIRKLRKLRKLSNY